MLAHRVMLDAPPFAQAKSNWLEQNLWPAHWVALTAATPPLVAAYQLEWRQESDAEILVHVSADESYELYLDGERIGRDAERGLPNYWFFESYRLQLAAGAHRLVARVWSQGAGATGENVQVRGARASSRRRGRAVRARKRAARIFAVPGQRIRHPASGITHAFAPHRNTPPLPGRTPHFSVAPHNQQTAK